MSSSCSAAIPAELYQPVHGTSSWQGQRCYTRGFYEQGVPGPVVCKRTQTSTFGLAHTKGRVLFFSIALDICAQTQDQNEQMKPNPGRQLLLPSMLLVWDCILNAALAEAPCACWALAAQKWGSPEVCARLWQALPGVTGTFLAAISQLAMGVQRGSCSGPHKALAASDV